MNSDHLQLAADLGRGALLLAVKISFPVLLAGLVVGALVSILQAATQVQDPTLNQLPKMLAIAAALFIATPWLLGLLADYTTDLVREVGTWFR
jgi:flagellar biosynthetic protein FliQ